MSTPREREATGNNLWFGVQTMHGYCPGTYGLWIDDPRGPARAMPLVFQPVGLYEETPPCLTLNLSEAQALMDELWRAGIRPTNGAGSVGQLAAIEQHLADFRRLAGKLLKVDLGELKH